MPVVKINDRVLGFANAAVRFPAIEYRGEQLPEVLIPPARFSDAARAQNPNASNYLSITSAQLRRIQVDGVGMQMLAKGRIIVTDLDAIPPWALAPHSREEKLSAENAALKAELAALKAKPSKPKKAAKVTTTEAVHVGGAGSENLLDGIRG